jgi:chromosome segregation ATPase
MASLNLSIVEILVLFFCAVLLGIVIHFFLTSRNNLKDSGLATSKLKKTLEDWKLKYFNDMEAREKELQEWKSRATENEESSGIYKIELEESKRNQKRLTTEVDILQKNGSRDNQPPYLNQLREAQASLLEHNDKITQLLESMEMVRETEEKQKLVEEENEQLLKQVKELRFYIGQKEAEIKNIQQKEHLTKEMTSMLDNAYSEFGTLQGKIQKLESQLSASKMLNLEYEDMAESYYKVNRETEEQKNRLLSLTNQNQQLTLQLNDTEDKLREANFQRQQLQKRVSYLEELNSDLQMVTEANKKLEHQLRRIGELESMLNVVSEERDILLKNDDDE